MSENVSNCSNFYILLFFSINVIKDDVLFWLWRPTRAPWFILSACLKNCTC